MNRLVFVFLALALLLIDRSFLSGGFFEWILKETLLLTVIPLLSLYFFKISPGEVGLSLKSWRLSVKYAGALLLLAIPIMLYGAGLESFRAYYPMWAPAGDSLRNFLLYQSMIAILMFNTEFLFRGYLLFSLEKELGKTPALILHAIPYMLVHIGKPGLEVPYSFFAGLVFGYMALKTRSILPGFLVHFLGSAGFEASVLYL
ncbi:CPBP family intramembrane metalloprotease [archaeon]|nr:CPBP family intramembrane metalloprotease [archaeon]